MGGGDHVLYQPYSTTPILDVKANHGFDTTCWKGKMLVNFGQSFPPNWVGRTSSNLAYKNDMCHLNM